MKNFLISITPKKQLNDYLSNVENSHSLIEEILVDLRIIINNIKIIETQNPEIRNHEVMKTEIIPICRDIKNILCSPELGDDLLSFWNLNIDFMKRHYGYTIDETDKIKLYLKLKTLVSNIEEKREIEALDISTISLSSFVFQLKSIVNKIEEFESKNNLHSFIKCSFYKHTLKIKKTISTLS